VLGALLHEVGPWLERYGYLAVAVLVLLDDVGVPAPGETVLILAGISAGQGRLNIVLVGVVGLAAAVLGDNLGYLLGRGARPLVRRYGRFVLLTPARLDRAERFVDRRGAPLILGARFVDGLRQLNGIAAGGAHYPWRRFVLFNAIGATAWVGVWTALSYWLGDRATALERSLGRYEWYVLGAAVVLVAALAVWRAVRHHRR
jgi:membrane protein DedA with SNARE-associated domain